ncbi:GNAT family N-acetyltransferase [Microvirga terricola]|uniref:GNAT family N-acetyltransferase n=1 Tax=Microvirga terricola TaxID=2719797 RepID=A0ABX0VB94_9HYPH|nr:GNAT family N-acetyltransferase [Microvirga terricola]NIX76616.1 GNAT family N-acetyltransferase [Microvirga terricola]
MIRADFDAQPKLQSSLLELRPLRREDLNGLFAAAGRPEVWAGHPAKDRYKRDVFEKYFEFLLETKSTLVVIDRQSDKIIGCSRYYVAPDQPDSMSIGFTFLNHAYWGGGTNFEVKRLMLDHAFQTFSEVWFHIAPTNIRSQKATAKLGAEHVYNATLNLSGTPSEGMCFRLSKEAWNRALKDKEVQRATG